MRPFSSPASRSLIVLFFLGIVLALWTLTPLRDFTSVENIRALSHEYKDSWGLFAIFVGVFAVGNFFFLPIPLISFAASLVFPLWKSLLCGTIGLAIAAILGYQLGRLVDVNYWPPRFRKFGEMIEQRLRGQAVWAVVLLRLAPTPPFTVTSVIAGSCRFQLATFVVGSLLGVWPLMILVNVLGVRILDLIEKPSTLSGLLLLTVIGLGLVFLRTGRRRYPA